MTDIGGTFLSSVLASTCIESSNFGALLFVTGALILNQNLQKVLSHYSDSDRVTNVLHQTLPESIQHNFREMGGIKFLNDGTALLLGSMLCFTRPRSLLEMFTITRNKATFRYGATDRHRIEIFSPVGHNEDAHGAKVDGVVDTFEEQSPTHAGPTLVFVHGGAWGCGQLWQYRLIANGIGNWLHARSIVLVGYPTYPVSTIVEQKDCIVEAVKFLQHDPTVQKLLKENYSASSLSNAADASTKTSSGPVVLCGHSSGANICALALLESVDPAHIGSDAAQALGVDLFLGLCGVYDVEKHYLFEANRGVHLISPMAAAARGKHNFWQCSPTVLVRRHSSSRKSFTMVDVIPEEAEAEAKAEAEESGSQRITMFTPPASPAPPLYSASSIGNSSSNCSADSSAIQQVDSPEQCPLPYTVLLHGTDDAVVPHTSSEEFAQALAELHVPGEVLYLQCDHMEPLLHAMEGGATSTSSITAQALQRAWAGFHRPHRTVIRGHL